MSLLLWFLVSVLFVFGAVQAGFVLARHRRRRAEESKKGEGPIGSVVGSVLGLLAFLLAFTFSIAAARYEQRKTLVMDESDAIEAAWLRADFLPEPLRLQAKEILRTYTMERANITPDPAAVLEVVRNAEKLQARLWGIVRESVRSDVPPVLLSLFTASVNLIIDLHSDRVTIGLQHRIPPMIWWCLTGLTFLAMAGVGYQFGLAGRENIWVQSMLAISFSGVVWLIANLDDPMSSMRVSQMPLLELAEKIALPK